MASQSPAGTPLVLLVKTAFGGFDRVCLGARFGGGQKAWFLPARSADTRRFWQSPPQRSAWRRAKGVTFSRQASWRRLADQLEQSYGLGRGSMEACGGEAGSACHQPPP